MDGEKRGDCSGGRRIRVIGLIDAFNIELMTDGGWVQEGRYVGIKRDQ